MFRGRCLCATTLRPIPSFIPFSPYRFLYRFRPSFNSPVFFHFRTRTDSRTEPSSLYPLPPLSLSTPYRKNRGRGEAYLFLATRHQPLATFPNSFRCHSYRPNPGVGSIKFTNIATPNWDRALNFELSTLNCELPFATGNSLQKERSPGVNPGFVWFRVPRVAPGITRRHRGWGHS